MQMFLKGNPTLNAVVASVSTMAFLLASFAIFEPVVTLGQDATSAPFTVTQTIGAEISFQNQPDDVTMDSSIGGIGGGDAYGTSTFNVTTNNTTGYEVRLAFEDTVAMQGDGGISTDIDNYTPGAQPNYDLPVPGAGESLFAYTVQNETTPADLDPSFEDNGSDTCGGGGTNFTPGKCWFNKADATAEEPIILSSAGTATTGATSSLVFYVAVGSGSSLENGTYTATGTLTAYLNP